MATIHINRGGTSLGTFSEEDVRAGLRSGRFAGTDLGWREGMASWQALSQFSEFAADIPSGAPTPPPSAPPPPAASTITPAPTEPTPETTPARSGLPWDERRTKGLLNAFIETLQMVLRKPVAAFTAMKREGGRGDPLSTRSLVELSARYLQSLTILLFDYSHRLGTGKAPWRIFSAASAGFSSWS